jgi:hypothetical protein
VKALLEPILTDHIFFWPTMPKREPSSQAEPKQGGDDLDDDFVPDELVALSADEGEEAGWEVDEEDAPGAFASEDEGRPRVEGKQSEYDEAKVGKKRKRREKERQRKAKVRLSSGFGRLDYAFVDRKEKPRGVSRSMRPLWP